MLFSLAWLPTKGEQGKSSSPPPPSLLLAPIRVVVRTAHATTASSGSRRGGIVRKDHPFLKLIGKGKDEAADVSANKYRYVALAIEKKR